MNWRLFVCVGESPYIGYIWYSFMQVSFRMYVYNIDFHFVFICLFVWRINARSYSVSHVNANVCACVCVFDVKFISQLDQKKRKGLLTWKSVTNFHGNANKMNMKLAPWSCEGGEIGFISRYNNFFAHSKASHILFHLHLALIDQIHRSCY